MILCNGFVFVFLNIFSAELLNNTVDQSNGGFFTMSDVQGWAPPCLV